MPSFDVLILGAGASGLLCSLECTARGRTVAVLDHSRIAARKVRISGGGRCNVTNLGACAEDYVCGNPHFVKSALARYTPQDCLEFLHQGGLETMEEDNGRIFCAQGAEAVAELLVSRARARDVRIILEKVIESVTRLDDGFQVAAGGEVFQSQSLVIALGGLAWPQIGATNAAYALARQFQLPVTPLRPGLVPLVAEERLKGFCSSLAGLSVAVRITCTAGNVCQGSLLFTHRGLSGPAILDASLFWKPGDTITLDFAPDAAIVDSLQSRPRMELRNALGLILPRRLAAELCDLFSWRGTVDSLAPGSLTAMEAAIHAFAFTPSGTEGFATAEVTLGGVDTAAISSKSMESMSVPGLFVIGEALDVTGRLGGFNLHWAWASGHAAGLYA